MLNNCVSATSGSGRTEASGDACSPTTRSLHVALVISHLGDGGAERFAAALARRWHHGGRAVSVVTIASRDGDLHQLTRGVRRVALGLYGPSRSLAHGMLQASGRVIALRRALTQLQPNVVCSFLERTNVLSLLATAGSRVPVLVCERSDPRQDAIGRPSWAALRRLLYPRAAGVIVQTESVAEWARSFCSRVHVIPNFVERPRKRASPGIPRGPRRLIAMGRLAPEKGFDLLLEAYARIAGSHPGWSLTILGEGPERRRLESIVRAFGLAGRVSMPGRIEDPQGQLADAHAFALPSRYEGFPNALLEAMACGLPVVAFDCPSGPAEIVTHDRSGLLVPAGDVSGFATALSRVMGSAADRVRLGRSAREVVVRFAPDSVLDRWSRVLSEVVRQ